MNVGTTEERRRSGRLVPEMSLVQPLDFLKSHSNGLLLDGVSTFKSYSQRRKKLFI